MKCDWPKCTVILIIVHFKSQDWTGLPGWPDAASQTFLKEIAGLLITFTRRMAIANGTCVSLSAISLRHILVPWLRPWNNRVNVTWMERQFNAGQTHCSIYPTIFNRLRAIAKYWSEIATFSYPLHLTPPLGCSHLEFRGKVWSSEN